MAATPKWAPGDVSRVGRGALELANKHKASIEPRLSAGLLDGLKADLDTFDGKQSAATVARESLREATRGQDSAADTANARLALARGAIVRANLGPQARAAFGLSLRPNPGKISSVLAALDAFDAGATRHPDLVRSAGLLTADLEKLRQLRATLAASDATQEATKLNRKLPVIDRKQAQVRIERAVDAIINGGVLAFADDPAAVALFRALVPARPATKKKNSPT